MAIRVVGEASLNRQWPKFSYLWTWQQLTHARDVASFFERSFAGRQ
jgi:hypothetical protein